MGSYPPLRALCVALSQPRPGSAADTLLIGVTGLISKRVFSQGSGRKPPALLLREHVRNLLFRYRPRRLNAEPGFARSRLDLDGSAPVGTSGVSLDEPVMAGSSDTRFTGVPAGRGSRGAGGPVFPTVGEPHSLLSEIVAESLRNCSLRCSENANLPCPRNDSRIQDPPGPGGGGREGNLGGREQV